MSNIVDIAKDVLKKEALAILDVMDKLGDSFRDAVETVYRCKGRVVLTGMGKSGFICRKIASTLSSVGTPAFFLHTADSLHGDLGMLQNGDVLIIISNSGETEEVIQIIPWLKRSEITTIVMTGNTDSTIARYGDIVIDTKVDEACPFNIVPTSSSTVALSLGDALAITVMTMRKFNAEDFANLHPGGTLGRKLLLTVEDLMHPAEATPMVSSEAPMKDAILEITTKRLGVTGVIDATGTLIGIITDGDLRRAIEKHDNIMVKKAADIMTMNPKSIAKDSLAASALQKMERYSITSLFVFADQSDRRPVGIVHIHDLLKAKIA